MSNNQIAITDERTALTVEGILGTDLNYTPFSSWYGSVKERMESSEEITETIFFQALEHIGAISRSGSTTLPPTPIYERMKGTLGDNQISWYCKKNSNISRKHIESYGICLDKLEQFEDRYLKQMLDILTFIEVEVQEEKEKANEWRATMKEKAGREKYRRITAQARSMVREAKEFIVREAFKKGDEYE